MRKILVIAVGVLLAGTGFGAELTTAPASQEAVNTPAATNSTQGTQGTATQKAGIPTALADRMDEWIGLLKAGKNRELAESLMSPEVLAQMKDDHSYVNTTMPTTLPAPGTHFNKAVQDFGKHRAAVLLTALQAARTQTPTLSEDGTKAAFPDNGQHQLPPLRFKKVADTWYLDGH